MQLTRTHSFAAVLCLPLALASCVAGVSAGARSGLAGVGAEYYYGTSTTTSPDGKINYGPPAMTLVRREVHPSDERIVETATRSGRTVVTTLEQQKGGLFTASASDNSVSGSIEFEGDDWQWRSWRYALELGDGSGTIVGGGRIDGKWLESDRYLVAPNGERRSRVIDRLARITQEEYERRMAEMATHPPR